MTQFVQTTKLNLSSVQKGAGNIKMTASSDLITNYEAAFPVSTEHDFVTLQDAVGNSILISKGGDDKLYAIVQSPQTKTGWKQCDITPQLNKQAAKVTTFSAFQHESGNILLACAVVDSSNSANSFFFISSQLSNDQGIFERDDFNSLWNKKEFQTENVIFESIYLGEACAESKTYGLVSVKENNILNYYLLNTDESTSWVWKKQTLVENATHTLKVELGQQKGYGGYYTLYDTADGRSLKWTSFPVDAFGGKTFSVFFQAPFQHDINTFGIVSNGSHNDDVYAGGDGVYLFKQGATTPSATIAEKGALPTVTSCIPRKLNGKTILWLSNGDGQLALTKSKNDDLTQWEVPLQLHNKVGKVSALANQYYDANQVFIVSTDNRLSFFSQDAKTTQWADYSIPIEDTGKTLEFNCYTTQLSFKDDNGGVIKDIHLKLAASALTYVTINGTAHILNNKDKDPITITPDAAGNITIINKVSSISTPVFELTSDSFSDVVDIDPSSKAQNILSEISSGDDLRKVMKADGTPLVGDDVDKDTVDGVGKAVNQFMNYSPDLSSTVNTMSSTTHHKTNLKSSDAHIRTSQFYRSALTAENVEDNHIWGIRFEGDKLKYHEGKNTHTNVFNQQALRGVSPESAHLKVAAIHLAAFNIGDIGHAIEGIAGDILSALEAGIESVAGFIVHAVGDIIEFVVEIGGKLVKFVVNTVETAMRAIAWVFNKIKVFFEDLIKWLGFLFDWKDIVRTKNIIKNVFNEALELGVSKVGEAEQLVDNFFAEISSGIDRIAVPAGNVASLDMKANGTAHNSPEANDFSCSAPGGFANYHIAHSGATSHAAALPADGTLDPTAFVTQVLQPIGKELMDIVFTLADDIKNLFVSNGLTVEQALTSLAKDVLKGVVELMKRAIEGFLKIIESALSSIKHMLNKTINIPVLGSLYKLLSGGDEMSVLDVTSLILAIPATMMYKILGGDPYPDGNTQGLDSMQHNELFRTLSDGNFGQTLKDYEPQIKAVREPLLKSYTQGEVLVAAATETKVSASQKSAAVRLYQGIGGATYFFADLVSLILRPINSETSGALPGMGWINLGIGATKLASTFPVAVSGATGALSYVSWGFSGTNVIASGIKATAGSGNPAVGEGVAVWNCFTAVVFLILGGSTFAVQMTEDPSAGDVAMDVASLTETILRSTGTIIDATATLDPDKAESGPALAATALILGFFALAIRGGRTAVIVSK